MSEQEKREVSRSVTTSLDEIAHGAALAANLKPDEADVVDARVTKSGELELELEGPQI